MPDSNAAALPEQTASKPPARTRRSSTAGRPRPRLLLEISNRIASLDSLADQLNALVDSICLALDAEVATLFLHDPSTDELYSRVARGGTTREIRIASRAGIAGAVFNSGQGSVIDDAYSDDRFDRSVDEKTGFHTRSIICAPVRTMKGETIGVVQALNKRSGTFTEDELVLVESIALQASVVLQSTLHFEKMERAREREAEFLGIVSQVSSEIHLGPLLQMIMNAITRLLDAERSTLFLNDPKTNQLYTEVGQGLGAAKITLPNHVGIAGAVFTSGKTINIPHAYADLRFNPSFDKQTGFFTRSILCVPVANKDGKTIGVTQVLNKRGGPFTDADEQRLQAFTAQISIGLENAKLFDDVQQMKNYNESVLESMSNGVVTIDDKRKIVTCNAAGSRILKVAHDSIVGLNANDFFAGKNAWVVEQIAKVAETKEPATVMDGELEAGPEEEKEKLSINMSVLPLAGTSGKTLGTLLLIEDISSEKRMKSTMSRYMDPALAEQLLGKGQEALGGAALDATILFSDVRSFTTLTEELGPQGTVQMLNEYFTEMVECISVQGGMLDKFIGDAIMAVFGAPFPRGEDEDRAVKCAISMMRELATLNKARAARGSKPIKIGIGLNTDQIISGNIGSPKRMEYTVIGDGVNLAARLESACKAYSAEILISEFTFKRLKGLYRTREADLVVVKGKTQPVAIYEVMDHYTDETFPNLRDVVSHFEHGLKLYRAGNWSKAVSAFEDALKANKKDKLSQTYIDRCQHFMAHPPEGEWGGVWTMTDK
jgi:adenylate cyclase